LLAGDNQALGKANPFHLCSTEAAGALLRNFAVDLERLVNECVARAHIEEVKLGRRNIVLELISLLVQMFELVASYPVSLPRLKELRSCLTALGWYNNSMYTITH
jgi:hypothetical protein